MAGANADQVIVLVNPMAGRGPLLSQVDQLHVLLSAKGFEVDVLNDLGEASEKAGKSFRAGRLRALISVGGDGTVAEIANRTDPGVPICVYPSGTANLLAKYLRMRPDPKFIAAVVDRGIQLRMDAALANGRVFLLHVGCGFDAAVVNQVHRQRLEARSGHISYWSYVNPILRTIRTYNYPEMEVRWERAPIANACGCPDPWVVRWLFVFNVPLYGWGLPLASWADATDGFLDVCAFQKGFFWNGLRYLAAAQCGWHRRLRDCQIARVDRLRVVAEEPVPYQLDGDPGGWLPLEIEAAAGRLTFLAPNS